MLWPRGCACFVPSSGCLVLEGRLSAGLVSYNVWVVSGLQVWTKAEAARWLTNVVEVGRSEDVLLNWWG
jgi:hypothetical protein